MKTLSSLYGFVLLGEPGGRLDWYVATAGAIQAFLLVLSLSSCLVMLYAVVSIMSVFMLPCMLNSFLGWVCRSKCSICVLQLSVLDL